jgi:hypothetical protein
VIVYSCYMMLPKIVIDVGEAISRPICPALPSATEHSGRRAAEAMSSPWLSWKSRFVWAAASRISRTRYVRAESSYRHAEDRHFLPHFLFEELFDVRHRPEQLPAETTSSAANLAADSSMCPPEPCPAPRGLRPVAGHGCRGVWWRSDGRNVRPPCCSAMPCGRRQDPLW